MYNLKLYNSINDSFIDPHTISHNTVFNTQITSEYNLGFIYSSILLKTLFVKEELYLTISIKMLNTISRSTCTCTCRSIKTHSIT